MATISVRLLLVLGLCHCDAPSSDGPALGEGVASTPDASATVEDTSASPDTADTGTAPDSAVALDGAGPDDPNVGCRVDSECGEGTICCTLATAYTSACVPVADCHEGLHDACLVDAQCQARRPGEWSVCCHDLRNRNYCAPIAATCQPLMACDSPADCVGNANDVCCSPHPYYGVSVCTSEFFANPDRDCP